MFRIRQLLWVALLICFIWPRTAVAQTTGSIVGQIVEQDSGRPISGVTVIITGPQGDQGDVTGEDGSYTVRGLPIGTYLVHFYFGDVTVEQPNVVVSVDKTVRVNGKMPASAPEVVRVVQKAPVVDVGSSRVGMTFDQDFTRNVPNTLTVGGMLEKAPGSFIDPTQFFNPPSVGLSFAGTTGAENAYILDGVNMTSIGYGTLGFDIASPFVEEVEIVTGGYGAEYGRAMGGVVNIATKSGSNEFKGSAFSYVTPGFLTGAPRRVYDWSSSLTGVEEREYGLTMGAEVGGPIIKNKLFFWVGYAPEFGRSHTVRRVDRFVDANGDGQPDDAGGHPVQDALGQQNFGGSVTSHQYAAKLSYRLAPDHNLSVGFYGINGKNDFMRTANADPRGSMNRDEIRRQDVSARWISRFFEKRWQLEANVGMHSEGTQQGSPFTDMNELNNVTYFNAPSLTNFDPSYAGECTEDATTHFKSCPVQQYQAGGYGITFDRQAMRLIGQLKSTHLFNAGGWHQVKYGGDYENNQFDNTRGFTGPAGGRGRSYVGDDFAQVLTFYRLKAGERKFMFDGSAEDPDPDKDGRSKPQLLEEDGRYMDSIRAETLTQNTSAFVQDSYSPIANLTLNVGVRWEAQQIKDYQGGAPITISDSFAPRIGAVYDPTNDGRGKVYGHFGRYYESIPMDINDRAFGGEGLLIANYADATACKGGFPGWKTGQAGDGWRGCSAPSADNLFGIAGENIIVQRKLKGSYSDELVLGGQYEVMEDLIVGAAYIKRWMGRAIEDGGTLSGGIVANPGSISQAVRDDYARRATETAAAAELPGATLATKAAAAEAAFVAEAANAVADFPKPKREYDALQITASKRFSRSWLLQASYTYSRTQGNYPGLYAADKDQLDPNITSLYDLADLLANRDGPLPNDRPHILRADGYYSYSFGNSALTTGLGLLARSGRPNNTLGSHPAYGQSETFILPRGSAGRTPVLTRFDLHLGYRTAVSKDFTLDAYVDIFNIFNQRTALLADQDYTLDPVEPIIGGDASDLRHLKNANGDPVSKNPNFLQAKAYQAPIAGRLGLRLSF